jgi:DNA-binding NarL/FixJ family response regulator
MRAGARGYLLKGATKEEILRAVTAVADPTWATRGADLDKSGFD